MDSSTFELGDKTLADDSTEPARLMLYRSAVQNCLQEISSSIKLDEFTGLFQRLPSFARKQHLVSRFYNILTNYINESVYHQVEEHIDEAELLEKFSTLEKLIVVSAVNKEKELWRPSHDVRKDLQSYVMQEKAALKEELERMVTAKEDVVNKLKYDILATENRAEQLKERMNGAENSLDKITERMDDFLENRNCKDGDVSGII